MLVHPLDGTKGADWHKGRRVKASVGRGKLPQPSCCIISGLRNGKFHDIGLIRLAAPVTALEGLSLLFFKVILLSCLWD
jgi:hypothetical protein